MDVVICVGPSDVEVFERNAISCKLFIRNCRNVIIITPKQFADKVPNFAVFVDEEIFPFRIKDVATIIHSEKRAGWYLQQLLKLYCHRLIPDLSDTYVIVDSDVEFQKPVSFLEDNKLLFNNGTEHHLPYFEHMKKLHSDLKKVTPTQSGICHLMPMKKHIAENMLKCVEEKHNETFWKVFLQNVDPKHKDSSGASEYEMLFSWSLQHFSNECKVVPLRWKNMNQKSTDKTLDYVANHWYIR